ncbi:hypothetical protein L195_g045390, partial [Trifolium pratense]
GRSSCWIVPPYMVDMTWYGSKSSYTAIGTSELKEDGRDGEFVKVSRGNVPTIMLTLQRSSQYMFKVRDYEIG